MPMTLLGIVHLFQMVKSAGGLAQIFKKRVDSHLNREEVKMKWDTQNKAFKITENPLEKKEVLEDVYKKASEERSAPSSQSFEEPIREVRPTRVVRNIDPFERKKRQGLNKEFGAAINRSKAEARREEQNLNRTLTPSEYLSQSEKFYRENHTPKNLLERRFQPQASAGLDKESNSPMTKSMLNYARGIDREKFKKRFMHYQYSPVVARRVKFAAYLIPAAFGLFLGTKEYIR
jgi:predicted protein tyrosine phosphatase